MMDFSRLRGEFAVTAHKAHLNHAGWSPMSARVKARVIKWAEEAAGEREPSKPTRDDTITATRKSAARLMGCRVGEVAFTSTTSEGVSLFAESLVWRVGDSVVTAANEFPANTYPWMNLKRFGVQVRMVAPTPEGRVRIEDLLAACDARTRVIAISWVGFNTGFRIDLARLGQECHKRGIHLFVDAIQGLGVLEMKAAEWHVTAAAAESHKWMLGTEGIALLYVSSDVVESLHPPVVGWRSMESRGNFMEYDFRLCRDARRFEPGCLNVAGIHVLRGALLMLEEAGIANITARIGELTNYLCERLTARGIEILSPRGKGEWSGVVSFRAPGGDGPAAAQALRDKGIVVTGRADFLRASPHFYNTEGEIDRLLASI